MSRIGPNALVVMIASAESTKPLAAVVQSSMLMMPAIVTRTLRLGWRFRTVAAAEVTLAVSVVSIVTVSSPGCSAEKRSTAATADDDSVVVLVQGDGESAADAACRSGNEVGVAGQVHGWTVHRADR